MAQLFSQDALRDGPEVTVIPQDRLTGTISLIKLYLEFVRSSGKEKSVTLHVFLFSEGHF